MLLWVHFSIMMQHTLSSAIEKDGWRRVRDKKRMIKPNIPSMHQDQHPTDHKSSKKCVEQHTIEMNDGEKSSDTKIASISGRVSHHYYRVTRFWPTFAYFPHIAHGARLGRGGGIGGGRMGKRGQRQKDQVRETSVSSKQRGWDFFWHRQTNFHNKWASLTGGMDGRCCLVPPMKPPGWSIRWVATRHLFLAHMMCCKGFFRRRCQRRWHSRQMEDARARARW